MAVTDPAPTDSASTDSASTDAARVDPAPTDPAPTDPAPTDSASTDAARVDPAPPAERGPLLVASGLEKRFPVRRGLLQRQVGAVRAVDGLDFVKHARAPSRICCRRAARWSLLTRGTRPP